MPWCSICRAEYNGEDGAACPKCSGGGEARVGGDPEVADPPGARPAHLAILDATESGSGNGSSEAPPPEALLERGIPRRRLISSAGPAVPIRKLSNDSVPSSWMARLEAARVVSTTGSSDQVIAIASDARSAEPPPLKPSSADRPPPVERTDSARIGKPAHLLVAELEAEEKRRADEEAQRVAKLFEENRSDDIAKVEILLPADTEKKKKIPDWVVVLLLVILVAGGVSGVVLMAKKEPGPQAVIDPAIAAAAEKRRQAVVALEEGHRLALEGKDKADDALRAYGRALEFDPTLAAAERGLAIAFASKDDDANAVEHYKSYLRLAPTAPDAGEVRKIIEKYEKTVRKKEPERESAAPAPPETKASPSPPRGVQKKNGRRKK